LPRAVDYGLLQKVVEHAHGISEVRPVQNSWGRYLSLSKPFLLSLYSTMWGEGREASPAARVFS
jgi:hypothetical protein